MTRVGMGNEPQRSDGQLPAGEDRGVGYVVGIIDEYARHHLTWWSTKSKDLRYCLEAPGEVPVHLGPLEVMSTGHGAFPRGDSY